MRKHRKHRSRTTQLLTMDELLARPCEVDGRPALFHRWVEADRAILRVDTLCRRAEMMEMGHLFHTAGIVAPQCSTEVIRETFALVEYRDGTIARVRPETIRFVGKEGLEE